MKKRVLAVALSLLMAMSVFTPQAEAAIGVSECGAENVKSGHVTLAFDAAEGTTLAAITVVPGEKVGELPESTKRENVFAGWYLEETYENELTSDSTIDEDTVVYAKWEAKGDVNLDKKVDANDALEILKYVAKMIKGFDTTYYEELGFEAVENEADLLAFPGADGYGKYTKGGRGGRVIYVTNLNDNGEGSLRAAIEAEGPRVVVFKVSGDIMLKSKLRIKNPYITIAGQTAPGDGICIRNYDMVVQAEHCIISYLRVRPGIYSEEDWTREDIYKDGRKDCIWVSQTNHVILEHISASFGSDETISVTKSDNVTVQDCILSESLNATPYGGAHAMGSILCGSYGQKVSYFRNLVATHRSRMPATGNQATIEEDTVGCDIEIVNNVFYNWQGYDCGNSHDEITDGPSRVNVINNYYKSGRETTAEYAWSTETGNQRMYMSGNAMNGVVPEDQYRSLVVWTTEAVSGNLVDWDRYIMPERCEKSILENIISPFEAYSYVMKNAGCSLSRDDFDNGITQSVVDGKGKLINKPEQAYGWTGAWPVLESTTPYADVDCDGMDDAWETKVGLDPTNGADGKETVAGGYTNLEVFIASLTQ